MLQGPVPHKGPLIKSTNSPFLQHFTTAKPHKPLIHCQTVNQNNNFNSSSHTDNLKDSQARQRLRHLGKQRKDPPIPEKLEYPGFLPPGSQIRKCKAGDLQEGTASLYYHCAWDGAGQKNILEFQVVSVQLPGTSNLQRLFLFFGKSLFWNTMQPVCITGQLHQYLPTVTASAPS